MSDWKEKALAYRKEGLSSRKICDKLGWARSKKSTINDFFTRHDRENKAVEELFEAVKSTNEPKLLFLDIEKTQALSGHFDQWQVNLSQDHKFRESHILSHSFAWGNGVVEGSVLDADELKKDVLRSFIEDDITTRIDENLVYELWALLDNADVVVAYNGKRYDIKEINSAFLKYGLSPPSPYKVIDPMVIAKQKFRLPFKSMKYLAEFLGVTLKIENSGIKLWKACLLGDHKAIETMLEYNKGDIVTLRDIFYKIIAWGNDGVNMALYNESGSPSCPHCASTDLEEVSGKFVYTAESKYVLYKCNTCTAKVRGNSRQNKVNPIKRIP